MDTARPGTGDRRHQAPAGRPRMCVRLRLACAGLVLAGCGLCGAPAAAHEVVHDIALAQTMTVQLRYSDGEPFAYESYELYADAAPAPMQTGRTDAQGRIAFFADHVRTWRLRAFSANGHGVDLKFDTIAADAAQAIAVRSTPDRGSRLLFGAALILFAFSLLQFFLRRKKR